MPICKVAGTPVPRRGDGDDGEAGLHRHHHDLGDAGAFPGGVSPGLRPRRLRYAAKGAEVRYFPAFWWIIMTIIRNIPEPIFKRLSI